MTVVSDLDKSSPRYAIVESDRYELDRDGCAFQLIHRLGPDYSERWLDELSFVVDNLAGFPGPLSHARDEEATTISGREVRRLLHHSPSHRRSKHPYRILLTVTPPASDDPDAETVIYLLRLLRGN